MRLGSVFERVNVVDLDLDLFGDDQVKELSSVLFKVGSFRDVAVDNGPHQLDVFGAELQDVDGGNGSRLKDIFISTDFLLSLSLYMFSCFFVSHDRGHNLLHCRMR